jgi:hypothetical protein
LSVYIRNIPNKSSAFCSSAALSTTDRVQLHVPSDVGVDQVFLPAERYATQDHLNFISNWTSKCDYMVFSRAQSDFATRLSVKNTTMDKVSVSTILGVWIEDSLGWGKNTKEICVKVFSRVSMLTKLKYIGVKVEDLFIRSVVEYCSVAFHSSLTIEQTNDLERIQKVCLKIILGDNFVDYRYKDSAIPYCQRKLNDFFAKKAE